MRYHVALANECTTETGAREGGAHNPNKIDRVKNIPTFYSKNALNPMAPIEVGVRSANRNGSGKKKKYEKESSDVNDWDFLFEVLARDFRTKFSKNEVNVYETIEKALDKGLRLPSVDTRAKR